MQATRTRYKELAYHQVQLVAISDGIDSTAKGAKLAFAVKAIMGDQHLDDLRDKTLRGLEGRAHKGLSTGGLPIAYRSIRIPGRDPRNPAGYVIEIDPALADVVRRIFAAYSAGRSFNGIAIELNQEGVPSPRDRTRHVRKGGWAGSSIRAILYNEKYVGVWTFNERRWIKVPGTNYVARSELLPLVLLTDTTTPAPGVSEGGRYTFGVAGARSARCTPRLAWR